MMQGGLLNFLIEPPKPEPAEKQFEREFASLAGISELIDEAYRRRLPTPAGYREDFADFVNYCDEVGVDPVTAGGPVIAMWLMAFSEGPKPYTRMSQALEAVHHFRSLQSKQAYVEGILEAASVAEAARSEPDDEIVHQDSETMH